MWVALELFSLHATQKPKPGLAFLGLHVDFTKSQILAIPNGKEGTFHTWQPLPEQISPAVKKEIHLSNRSCMTIPISLFEKFLVEGTSVSRAPLGNMKLAQITGQGCAGWCWDTGSVKWRFTVLCSCKWVLTKGGPCGGRTSRSGSVLIRGVKLQTLNLRPKWACWELCSIPETAAQRVWLTSCAAETPSNVAGDPAGVK